MSSSDIQLIHQKALECSKTDPAKAIAYYEQILDICREKKKDAAVYHQELATLYKTQRMFELAAQSYIVVLKTLPERTVPYAMTLNEIGCCYFELKKYKEALPYFHLICDFARVGDAHRNIAYCYRNLNDSEGFRLCEKHLLLAKELDPTNPKTSYDLSELCYLTKNYKQSIYWFVHSKTTDPNFMYNASFSYLALKNFALGFKYYENRLATNRICQQTGLKTRVEFETLDYWDGKTPCRSVLVIYEQGFGDNIQYFRFIIQLAETHPNIQFTFICNPLIHPIFRTDLVPNLTILASLDPRLISHFQYKVYTMSLPYILGIQEILPNPVSYISLDEDCRVYWKDRMSDLKRFKIGFVYSGLLQSYLEKHIPLSAFQTLLDLPIDLICIHRKSEVETDLASVDPVLRDRLNIYEEMDLAKPFVDTIALLQNIDLLVTVDTYIVHLAGVMGVKTWLLLGNVSEWRWSTDSTAYWYSSVDILRAPKDEPLESVLGEVKTRLQGILSR